MSKPNWSITEITEILSKANGLFATLVGLTTTPREGAEIICMMHMLLYMNYGDASVSTDEMLSDYCKNFQANFKAQAEAHQKVSN